MADPSTRRMFLLWSATAIALQFGYHGANTWLPSYVVKDLGVNLANTGWYVAGTYAMMVLGKAATGYLADILGRKTMWVVSGLATAIYFLLEAHQRSHWHKVDAAEIWLWHAGDPLLLSLSTSPRGPVRDVRLGPDVVAGDHPHYVIGAHEWQAASALPGTNGYTLVSCVVVPAFEFSGFTLAPPDWRPGK